MSWLQKFVNNFYRCVTCCIEFKPLNSNDLVIECDETDSQMLANSFANRVLLWSFVCSKENGVYIWLAFDRKTKRIIGVHLGDRRGHLLAGVPPVVQSVRSRKSAEEFWNSLPQEYRENATVYTDLWISYQQVIPVPQHQPSFKNSGETNHIERFNNTLRQRCSRQVRKTLSFSKNFFNHEGAIWYFIHHYNEVLSIS